ncbi:MAG: PmoA family protein [Planctomycetales bacterium]|nr:PmoA family protein [Planctomycetales bacterium]
MDPPPRPTPNSLGLSLGCLLAMAAYAPAQEPAVDPVPSTPFVWQRDDSQLTLSTEGHAVWRFHFGNDVNVPFFDPVGPVNGPSITWNAPADHRWHHALWFSWKYINGINYWEHQGDSGKPSGSTEWSSVDISTDSSGAADITMELSYRPASSDQVALRERRTLHIAAPDAAGDLVIDWSATFRPVDSDATLDRSPPQPNSSGGYAGLSVRFAQQMDDRLLVSEAGPAEFNEGNRFRGRAKSLDYSGTVESRTVGLALLDHPQNHRFPTRWYAIRNPIIGYLNAAVLHDEPITLTVGDALTLRYRIVAHYGRWDASRLQQEADRFAED